MRFRSLNAALYGDDEQPDETEVPERSFAATPPEDVEQAASQPVESEPTPEPAMRVVSQGPKLAPAPAAEKDWSPNLLGAIAAFTKNPVLMEKLRAQEGAKTRAAQQAKADAMQSQQMSLAKNKDAREQAKFEAERPYFGAGGASKNAYAQATQQRMQEQQMDSDRASDRSKAVSGAAAAALQAQVALMDGKAPPNVVAMLKRTADSMAGMSVSEIKSIFKSSPLASVAPQALGEAQRAFADAMSKDSSARGWYSAKEGVRQGDERLDLARTAEDRMQSKDDELTIKKPQEKLNHDISKLEVATQQMQDALATKGQVNTGPIIQGLRDLIHADSFDAFTSDDRIKLRSLGASIFNEKVHEISGAAVSESEWKRIAPQIPQDSDDDRIYAQKLERALAITQQVLGERRKEYQMNGGKPADRSVTAREQGQKLAPTRATPKPVVDADPRVARAKEILQDPAESPEKKAKAERWLKANGN